MKTLYSRSKFKRNDCVHNGRSFHLTPHNITYRVLIRDYRHRRFELQYGIEFNTYWISRLIFFCWYDEWYAALLTFSCISIWINIFCIRYKQIHVGSYYIHSRICSNTRYRTHYQTIKLLNLVVGTYLY